MDIEKMLMRVAVPLLLGAGGVGGFTINTQDEQLVKRTEAVYSCSAMIAHLTQFHVARERAAVEAARNQCEESNVSDD